MSLTALECGLDARNIDTHESMSTIRDQVLSANETWAHSPFRRRSHRRKRDSYGLVLRIDAAVVRGTDRDVVGMNRVVLEHFLHRDADRGTAAPDGDQERRAHAACDHPSGKLQRVLQQLVGRNE